MNNFVYDIPTKVYFGKDQLSNLASELSKYGKRVLLVYGGGSIKKNGLYDSIISEIEKENLELFELSGVEPNPRIQSVRKGVEICKKNDIDVLLAVGGGSTIDATKFIAAGSCIDFDPWDFFTKNAPIDKALPIVTILTLAATGSEMDTAGVISNPDTNDKLARMAPPLLPKVSFLDPTATFSVSKYQTACGSADIMNHIMEVYFNMNQDLFMLDTFMEGMLKTVIKYAPIAMIEPDNYEARANLMWTSSWAINSFVNGGKQQEWSCHPIEHEVSAIYDITHGLGLAIIGPRWLEYCLDETTVSKYYQYGTNVFGIDSSLAPMEVAKKSIEMTADFLYNTLGLTSTFGELGIKEEDIPLMAKKSCLDGTIQGFKPLNQKDIENILKKCM
jgi:alcohol dehydrogenase YqhD (iron-dependent ADH family)